MSVNKAFLLLCAIVVVASLTTTNAAFTREAISISTVSYRSPPRHLSTTASRRPCRPPVSLRVSEHNNNNNQHVVDERIQDKDFMERTKQWVVLVDDEEAIRLAVGDYLYDRGYQVTACADADALLEVCTFQQDGEQLPAVPDAIVSDVRMPGKDGLELLKLIRADERLGRVPVIMLTAKGMTQDRIEGYKAGADVYLPKPFNPEELLSILDNAIKRRKQMTGTTGKLVDLKAEMSDIKQLLKQNGSNVVKATNVYLTPVERQVLELLCKGCTNAEIAEARGVSVIGVNRVIQKLYVTTETRTRTELVRWAIETGYVSRKR